MFQGFQTQNTETSPKKQPEVPANGDAAVATPRLAEAVTGATALAVSAVLDFLYSGSWTAGLPSSNLYIIYKEYEYRYIYIHDIEYLDHHLIWYIVYIYIHLNTTRSRCIWKCAICRCIAAFD